MTVFADADAIRPEHIIEFFGLLGGGQHDAGLDGSRRPEGSSPSCQGLRTTRFLVLLHWRWSRTHSSMRL
jgi:hypothetical protein